jgi:hypothetical protein
MIQSEADNLRLAAIGAADEQTLGRPGSAAFGGPRPEAPGGFVGEHLPRLINQSEMPDDACVRESAMPFEDGDDVPMAALVCFEHWRRRRVNRRIGIRSALQQDFGELRPPGDRAR